MKGLNQMQVLIMVVVVSLVVNLGISYALYQENEKLALNHKELVNKVEKNRTDVQSEFNSVNYKLGQVEGIRFEGEVDFLENTYIETYFDPSLGDVDIYLNTIQVKTKQKGNIILFIEVYDVYFDLYTYQAVNVIDGVGEFKIEGYDYPDYKYVVLGGLVLK